MTGCPYPRMSRALVVLFGAGLLLARHAPAQAAAPVTKTFTYAGMVQQEFFVPNGVTALQVTVNGAPGGAGWHGGSTGGGGGSGSQIAGGLVVAPGEDFSIQIGGAGGDGSASKGFCVFNDDSDISQGGLMG